MRRLAILLAASLALPASPAEPAEQPEIERIRALVQSLIADVKRVEAVKRLAANGLRCWDDDHDRQKVYCERIWRAPEPPAWNVTRVLLRKTAKGGLELMHVSSSPLIRR